MSLLAMSLRSVLRVRRVVAVAALPLGIGLLAVLIGLTAGDADRTGGYATLAGELLLLIIGIVALVLGVNAFGDDRDERTLGLLLATTLPRWQIVLAKYAAATAVTCTACLPAVLGCLVLARNTGLSFADAAWSLLLGGALGAAAYVALFVLLSLVLRRAVLVGLAYLVLWEGLLAGTTVTFRNLSIGAHASRVVGAPFDDVPFSTADSSVAVSVGVLLVVSAAAVALAAWRLSGRPVRASAD